jgi:hypothetical protein
MATLQNTTVSDTGYIGIPIGTAAQRPGVSVTGASKGLGCIVNGLQLYIPTAWATYQNIPDYLMGAVCTTTINEGNYTFTISLTCTAYQIYDTTWGQVDHTGWTPVETSKSYISGYTNNTVASKTLTPGSYTLGSSSCMYAFVFPNLAGTIRYNSTYGVFEGYTGQTWTPLNTPLPNNNSASVFTASGTYTAPASTQYVNVLLVGGGGGGGLCMGGGGGGGGVRYITNVPVNPGGAYPVSIGGGGSGANNGRGNPGGRGGSTQFGNFWAAAGGGGGATWDGGNNQPGGSGGGACQGNTTNGTGNTPVVYPPQGYPGGVQGGAIGNYSASGGGGGAGGGGGDGTTQQGGIGGSGVLPLMIGGAGQYGAFGNGGGGGTNGGTYGRGTEGGGYGSTGGGAGSAADGNTGGGGGGGGFSPDGPGGAGGSGICIVQPVTFNSPT